MLMDQRVISTSAVRCVGNTLHPPGPRLLPALRHHRDRRPGPSCARPRRSPAVADLPAVRRRVGLGYDVKSTAQQTPRLRRLDQPRARAAAHAGEGGPLDAVRRSSGELLITLGLLLLLFVGWQLWWTDVARRPRAGPRPCRPLSAATSPRAARHRRRRPGTACAGRRSARRSRSCASRGSGADYARPVLEGTSPDHPGGRRRPLRRHGAARRRSATSRSPVTASPTAGRSTRSTELRAGDAVVVETADDVLRLLP